MTISTVRTSGWVHRVTAVAVGAAVLSATFSACSSSTEPGGNDPCFKAQQVATNDVRIVILNVSETDGVRVVVNGPDGQTRTCDPVSTDADAPTNVVMNVAVGQNVTFSLFKDGATLGGVVCTLTEAAYSTPDQGKPGNADITFFVSGNSASVLCAFGFQ